MAQEIQSQEMSTQFHQYVRHLIECPDGHTREKLQAIEAQIRGEIGEYNPNVLEDPITHQRRLELSYVQGYLKGPGPAAIDIEYDQQEVAQHQAETKPKQRRGKRQ